MCSCTSLWSWPCQIIHLGLIVRNRVQGECAMCWRLLQEECSFTETGNVQATWAHLVEAEFELNEDALGNVKNIDESMARYQKMSGEQVSDHM